MPKITHILFSTLVAINILTINAMNQQEMVATILENKKDIVIALSDNIDIKNYLNKCGFDNTKYEIIKINTPTTKTILPINFYPTKTINRIIQNKKTQNPACKIYLHIGHNLLHGLNYAANNSHTIDGLILDNPVYFPNRPLSKRLFDFKLSHIAERLPNTMPIVINHSKEPIGNEDLVRILLSVATSRKIYENNNYVQFGNKKYYQIHHKTFTIKDESDNAKIAEILQKPQQYLHTNYRIPTPPNEETIAKTIKHQETRLYYIERFIMACGAGLLIYLYKIRTLAMLMRLIV